MIGIFVYVIILIALVASLGFSVLQFNQSAERSAMTQRNASRMDAVAAILRGNSAPLVPGGVARLPAPVNAAPYEGAEIRSLLPTDLVGDDRTGWGARFGYCPLALPGGAAEEGADATVMGGGNYGIKVASSADRDYVVGVNDAPEIATADGFQQPQNVMGFIVSPTPGNSDIPRCDEIIYRDGSYVIGRVVGGQVASPTVGGTVLAILGDASILSYVPAEFAPTIYVSPTGDGSGRSGSDAMGLAQAVNWWDSNLPPSLIISLAGGAYDASGIDLAFMSPRSGDRLVIKAMDAVTITASQSVSFNQEAEIDGVSFTGAGVIATPGARVILKRSGAAFASARGGEITVMSDTVLASNENGRSGVEVLSGKIILADAGEPLSITTTGAPAITVAGGHLDIAADIDTGATMVWSVSSGIMELGRKSDGSLPLRNGLAVETVKKVLGVPVSGSNAATSCPMEQPYLIQASCVADQGALRSSYRTEGSTEGWSCWWSGDGVSSTTTVALEDNALALPGEARADLVCSATPAR